MCSGPNGTQLDSHLPSLTDPSSDSPLSVLFFLFQCSVPDGTPSGMIFRAGGCVYYPSSLVFLFLAFLGLFTLSLSLVIMYGGRVMWLKSGFSSPRRSSMIKQIGKRKRDEAVLSFRRPSDAWDPEILPSATTASCSHVRLPTPALISAPLR